MSYQVPTTQESQSKKASQLTQSYQESNTIKEIGFAIFLPVTRGILREFLGHLLDPEGKRNLHPINITDKSPRKGIPSSAKKQRDLRRRTL